jgi:NADH:ubiquinone oxidoreductase subunit D
LPSSAFWTFVERASRSRLHAAYFPPGGVHQDLPKELLVEIKEWCNLFPRALDDIDAILTNNRIFKQRTVDIGVISLKEAWTWGFTGVMLRALGQHGICDARSHTSAIPSSNSIFQWEQWGFATTGT